MAILIKLIAHDRDGDNERADQKVEDIAAGHAGLHWPVESCVQNITAARHLSLKAEPYCSGTLASHSLAGACRDFAQ